MHIFVGSLGQGVDEEGPMAQSLFLESLSMTPSGKHMVLSVGRRYCLSMESLSAWDSAPFSFALLALA